jgi:hypothetical protein
MAMDKDILGQALYNVRQDFQNRSYNDLIAQYGSMEAARLDYAKKEADVFIKHVKDYADVPGTGLVAPGGGGAVTGMAKIS